MREVTQKVKPGCALNQLQCFFVHLCNGSLFQVSDFEEATGMFSQVLEPCEDRYIWPVGSPFASADVDLVLYFGSREQLASGNRHTELQNEFPAAVVCGCSTGGQIVGDTIVDDVVVAMGFVFERTEIRLVAENLADPAASRSCGEALGRTLAASDGLAGVFVLADGLNVNGNDLVTGLVATLGEAIPITGGMACDGTVFGQTLVAGGAAPRPNVVAAIGFYGPAFRMGYGSGAGWQVFGPHRRVTRSSGNRVYDVDGAPILDLYRRYLGDDEFAGLPRTGLLYPLQIHHPEAPDMKVIRAVLGVDHTDGSMYFGGDIPVGSIVQLMRGNFQRLAEGAGQAAAAARDCVDTGASAAILVSCIGRRILMGSRTEDEVVAVAEEFGTSVPCIGFYSLGEISPFPGTHCTGLHNQTMTVVAFSERMDPA
ncbi:MAG: FIST N-terminal domain-containing protein [Ancalomicrobiaceae bacterium]|nr:FIST N-terminal domain-containing protein [Ancalomicrobiaceae bacterium]